jgi:stage II sporulation protein D
MRCGKFAVIIALLALGCGHDPVVMPFSTVKVCVLGRHRLHDAVIETGGGRLFLPDKTITLEKATVKLGCRGDALAVHVNGTDYRCGHLSLSSPGIITVVFTDGAVERRRLYLGSLDVSPVDNSLAFVLATPVEAYVRAAARSELGPLLEAAGGRDELLRAMEIVVRSFVAGQKTRHEGKEYRFCDLTHCVHFEGMRPGDTASLEPGEVLVDGKGRILVAYFHAACGGILSGPESYWRGHAADTGYRRGPDRLFMGGGPLCSASPHSRWRADVPVTIIEEILETAFTEIAPRFREGRVYELRVRNGNRPEIVVPVARFLSRAGRRLGWNVIKSNYFIVTAAKGYCVFEGRGLGHGVGLCQWGARELALRGKSSRQILEFYFDGADVRRGTYR